MAVTHRVDVVVVSYNSRDTLRDCLRKVVGHPGINVIVVDNASADGSPEVARELGVTAVAAPGNVGFGSGCNLGWPLGEAPYTLFLNPDASISVDAVEALTDALDADPDLGAVGPRILNADGSLDYSQRRFPRVRSTFAVALMLHRLLPRASWTDEIIRTPESYDQPGDAEWISGACMMVRRSLLERIGGFDEGFFLYLEDTDLCKRMWDSGARVGYSPMATCTHIGGASAPRWSLVPVHTASKVRYAAKHDTALAALGQRAGLVVWALVRIAGGAGGRVARAGYLQALGRVLQPNPRLTP